MRCRSHLIAILTVVLVASEILFCSQYAYSQGYGGWGWNGWGSSTPAGNTATGLASLAQGAGQFRESTAQARAVNANTVANWNEYIYQSQQVASRHYQERLAKDKKDRLKGREAVYRRLRDNPSVSDITRGDALNVALDELSNPKLDLQSLPGAKAKVEGAKIRDIPFRYASEAITTSMYDLVHAGPPPALTDKAFEADRREWKKISAELRKENQEQGELQPETIRKAQELLKGAWAKAQTRYPAGTAERLEAEKFLKAVYGLTRMLESPAISVLLSGVEKRPDTTLGDLLSFMKAFNLRFGPAKTPRQQGVYNQIYPLLIRLRDQAAPRGTETVATAPQPGQDTRPGEFFSGMEFQGLDTAPSSRPPAPRPPAPRPR